MMYYGARSASLVMRSVAPLGLVWGVDDSEGVVRCRGRHPRLLTAAPAGLGGVECPHGADFAERDRNRHSAVVSGAPHTAACQARQLGGGF